MHTHTHTYIHTLHTFQGLHPDEITRLKTLVTLNKLAAEEQALTDKLLADMEKELMRRERLLTAKMSQVYTIFFAHVHMCD